VVILAGSCGIMFPLNQIVPCGKARWYVVKEFVMM
jgi:hypothetical protein